MNYYRFPNKFEYTTNHLISTPASSSTMKLASMRHEKSTSLLKLPPIKTSKALLPQPKAMLLPENYKNISDGKEFNDYARESSNSPIKRILLHKKMGSKENRSVEPHQRNLKESNGLLSDSSLNDMKLSKSPLNEHKTNYSLEHMTNKTPKSEQTHLPKMQNKRLEGMSDLKIGSFPNFSEENHRNNSLLTSVKHKEHFQFFFNPSILLSEQLLDKNDLPKLEFSKCSSKKNGVIKAYSANTHQGLIRNYNEDRVAIILNIIKPANKKIQEWPSCSFFAIYDGHGGSKCAEFLRDNLHHYIIKDSFFPAYPKMAIKRGLQSAEKTFLEQAQQGKEGLERSGSCAIILLIVDDICFIANVGDSRAVLSNEKGNKIIPLSLDHKPGEDFERKRIIEAGGQIYQSHTATSETINGTQKIVTGPFRVLPGRLSVSRTFGDAEAKLESYGGNPKVITAEPDIKSFKISNKNDFILLGCDGIFDKLNNVQAIQSIWETLNTNKECKNMHEFSGRAVENLMKEAMIHKSLDNVTVVMICLKNFKNTIFPNKKNKNLGLERQGSNLLKKMQLIEMNYEYEEFNEKCNVDEEIVETQIKKIYKN